MHIMSDNLLAIGERIIHLVLLESLNKLQKGFTVSLFVSQCQISNTGLSAVIQRKKRSTALNVVCPAGKCI